MEVSEVETVVTSSGGEDESDKEPEDADTN